MMSEINVAEARQRLSELLDAVAEGDEVRILRHGKPVARLVPVEPAGKALPSLATFRDDLHVTGEPASRTLLESRREGR